MIQLKLSHGTRSAAGKVMERMKSRKKWSLYERTLTNDVWQGDTAFRREPPLPRAELGCVLVVQPWLVCADYMMWMVDWVFFVCCVVDDVGDGFGVWFWLVCAVDDNARGSPIHCYTWSYLLLSCFLPIIIYPACSTFPIQPGLAGKDYTTYIYPQIPGNPKGWDLCRTLQAVRYQHDMWPIAESVIFMLISRKLFLLIFVLMFDIIMACDWCLASEHRSDLAIISMKLEIGKFLGN